MTDARLPTLIVAVLTVTNRSGAWCSIENGAATRRLVAAPKMQDPSDL